MGKIKIDGERREVAPLEDRKFRAAWQLDGDVVSIDIERAKEIKRRDILSIAGGRAAQARRGAMEKAMRGEPTTAEDAEAKRFSGKPKPSGIKKINDAKTVEELAEISPDDLFNPPLKENHMATVTTTSTSTSRVVGDAEDWVIGFTAMYQAMAARQDARIAAGEVDENGDPLKPFAAVADMGEGEGDILRLGKIQGGVETLLIAAGGTSAVPFFDIVDNE